MLKSGYLKSAFTRNGEEGLFTRLINSPLQLAAILTLYKIELRENEEALIWYQEENRYLMVTNQQLIFRNSFTNNEQVILDLTQIKGVNYVIKEQEIVNPSFKMTVFAITDFTGNRHLLKVEAHNPAFAGIYQLLHAAITKNWARAKIDGTVL
jgi:hypothetical protein